MKYSFIAVVLIMIISIFTLNTSGQNNLSDRRGLYLTAQDFINKKLSYSNENSNGRYKIKVAPLSNKDRVRVIQNREKHDFFQFDLYGYRDKNQDYRFFNDQQYEVIDNSFFYMYTRIVSVVEGKVHTQKTNYYFSKLPDGNIMDLTLYNLKRAYPENHKFQDLLDVYFRYDNDLNWYDSFNKMYKVEHIFGDTFDETSYSINR